MCSSMSQFMELDRSFAFEVMHLVESSVVASRSMYRELLAEIGWHRGSAKRPVG